MDVNLLKATFPNLTVRIAWLGRRPPQVDSHEITQVLTIRIVLNPNMWD